MKLVVGLGNPGNQYAETRHNLAWMVLDRIADRAGRAGRGRDRDASSVLEIRAAGQELRARQAADVHERLRARGPPAARRATTCRSWTCWSSRTTSPSRSASCGSARPARTAGTTACARSSATSTARSSAACGSGIGEPGRGAVDHVLSRFTADETARLPILLDAVRRGGRDMGPRGDVEGGQPVQRLGAPGARRGRRRGRRGPAQGRARSADPPTPTGSAGRRPAGGGSCPAATGRIATKGGRT